MRWTICQSIKHHKCTVHSILPCFLNDMPIVSPCPMFLCQVSPKTGARELCSHHSILTLQCSTPGCPIQSLKYSSGEGCRVQSHLSHIWQLDFGQRFRWYMLCSAMLVQSSKRKKNIQVKRSAKNINGCCKMHWYFKRVCSVSSSISHFCFCLSCGISFWFVGFGAWGSHLYLIQPWPRSCCPSS